MADTRSQSDSAEVGRRGKSATAYRTIGEAASGLDLPQHVLRFWETKFPQLSPVKRKGGRRYYRPEDLALLRQIRDLLHRDGYTIKGVQKLLKETSKTPPSDPASAAHTVDPQATLSGRLDLHKKGELEVVFGELKDMRALLD